MVSWAESNQGSIPCVMELACVSSRAGGAISRPGGGLATSLAKRAFSTSCSSVILPKTSWAAEFTSSRITERKANSLGYLRSSHHREAITLFRNVVICWRYESLLENVRGFPRPPCACLLRVSRTLRPTDQARAHLLLRPMWQDQQTPDLKLQYWLPENPSYLWCRQSPQLARFFPARARRLLRPMDLAICWSLGSFSRSWTSAGSGWPGTEPTMYWSTFGSSW